MGHWRSEKNGNLNNKALARRQRNRSPQALLMELQTVKAILESDLAVLNGIKHENTL